LFICTSKAAAFEFVDSLLNARQSILTLEKCAF